MGRITPRQVYMFFTQFLISTIIGFFISPLARNAGFMVWLSVIIGAAMGLFIAYLSYRLAIKRRDRLFWQYGSEIVGKWIHYPISLALIFITLFSAAFILRQLTDFMVQNYLPDTPNWAVAVLFGICVARGVRSGAASIFRSAQGLFFFSIISLLIFPLFVARELRTEMAIGFLTNFDWSGTWNGSLMVAALFGEMAFIAYFFAYFAHPEKVKKSLLFAAVTAVIIILADITATILLFGPDLSANLTYPMLELIRYIRTGVFLENLDPLLIVFWLYSMFLKISFLLLTSVTGLTYTMGLKDHKPFSYMMAAFAIGLSLFMFESVTYLERLTRHAETAFLLFLDIVPVLYLVVDWLRSIRKNKKHDQSAQAPVNGS